MLAERVIEWTQEWQAEGFRAGWEEGFRAGWAEALVAVRALLLRQANVRFGVACTTELAPLLAICDDTAVLEDIGEWIITSDSATTLIARTWASLGGAESAGASA